MKPYDGTAFCQPESRLSPERPDYDRVARQTASRLAVGEEARWPLPTSTSRPEVVAPVGYAVRFLGTGLSPKMYSGVIVAVEPDAKFGRLHRVYAEDYPSKDGTCLRPRHALYEEKTPADYDRVARQAAAGESEGSLDQWHEVQLDRERTGDEAPVRREPRERGKGRGRWLALDTMDHVDETLAVGRAGGVRSREAAAGAGGVRSREAARGVGCVQRSQQRMTAGGVQDGANLVRIAFEELRSLHESLKSGALTDDAWDV
jgi:hypothetical protein